MAKATTVRFTDEVFARLDQASARIGMPVNSIVVAACLEWLAFHVERTATTPAPRWATLRRAVGQAFNRGDTGIYPFEHFTMHARELLALAQAESQKRGESYLGTEHLLLGCFGTGFHSAKVLAQLGLERESVDARIDSLLAGDALERRDRFAPTQRVKRVIEIAFQLSSTSSEARVGTHHVLWALSKEGGGLAAQVLDSFGAPLQRIETEIESVKDPES